MNTDYAVSVPKILRTLRADQHFVLARGIRDDGASVLILAPQRADSVAPARHKLLEHEYSLAPDLDSSWAARPLALVRDGTRTLLLLEDPGGEPLTECLSESPPTIGQFLQIAISVTNALRHVHEAGLIHRDIRPANVLLDAATGAVRLLGFGCASRISLEPQPRSFPEAIAASLPYTAPEQTGRMSRSVDTRSDLYALGVTLYEVLTGRLPFTAADPLEWIHCHLARHPTPPIEHRPDVPECVSRILMRLLEKTPEQRYQTAAGVIRDLTRSLHEWEATGTVSDFTLGTRDVPPTLRISEHLYGRERELAALHAVFERVARAEASEGVLISGPAGVGKSHLVQQLRTSIERFHGGFASGKCDEYKNTIPYAPIAEALQSLTTALLELPEAQLSTWRQALAAAAGHNGRLLVNLVPQLELLIGKQADLTDLPPHEALTQLQITLRRVLAVLARSEHPLVLFFDDLQWMDAASAGILEDLASADELQHLLLVYTFRVDESGPSPALARTLSALRTSHRRFVEITLKPLGFDAVSRLISEALACDANRCQPLARLVYEKTGGNPFFTIQFLMSLCQEGLLKLDDHQGRWTWNLRRIQEKSHTDNVLNLMAASLARLPEATRDALKELACLGSAVDFETLGRFTPGEGVLDGAALERAVHAGYLIRLTSGYRFAHDRIHESAYALVSVAQRPAIHLRLGRLLASRTPAESFEREIFAIVNQLGRGLELVTDPAEREQIARYHLTAGLRAKDATGYASALEYLRAGRNLLREDCWNTQHELFYSFEFHMAQCEYLTAALEAAEQRMAQLASRTMTLEEACAVACLRTDINATANRGEHALEICLDFLRGLGMDWSPHPGRSAVDEEFQRIWSLIGERAIEDLIHLPLMNDARAVVTINMLSKLALIATHIDPDLLCLVIGRMVNLSLTHGHSAAGSVGYATFGMILAARYQDYHKAFQFVRLGVDVVKARGFNPVRARVWTIYGATVSPWKEPLAAGIPWAREAVEQASNHGDLNFATYALQQQITHRLLLGEQLCDVEKEVEATLEFARRGQVRTMVGLVAARRGLIRSLRGLTASLGCFDHPGFAERAFEEDLRSNPWQTTATCLYWIYKLQAHYLEGDYSAALAAASRANALLWAAWSLPDVAEFHLYSALARTASYEDVPEDQRLAHDEALAVHQTQLATWARDCCPYYFTNRKLLLEAECARIQGHDSDAIRLYEAASRAAHENGFVYIEAIACELAGRFYLKRGSETAGYAHLQKARAAYLRWGADAKVKQLEQLFPALRAISQDTALTALESAPEQQLDVLSVIRTSHALASAVTLQDLIETLMRIALENAGADRGLLIRALGETPRIEAEAVTRGEKVEVRLCDLPIAASICPESLLWHVIRTRNRLIVADATELEPLYSESYERRPKSIICVPIVKQARLSGLLYLENNLTSDAFTPDRAALLEVIAAQAAIALENTRLYTDLKEREMRIRRLVDSNIIGVMFWDFSGRITDANDAFLSLVGYSREDLLAGNIDWKKLTPPGCQESDASAVRELQQTGTHAPLERECVCKDGSRIPVLVGGAFLHGSHQVGVSFVLDLTERRRAEAERQAHQVAEAANRAKSQFLATMSHELRTPLNGILGYAQILGNDRLLNDRQHAAVEVIHRGGRQLLALINDILDLAKIEAGRFELTFVEISLPEFLRSVVDVIRVNAAQRGLKLICDWDTSLPARIRADEDCLQRVLLNLLSNAVKFTDRGEVGLQVRFSPPARLRFQVHDTGIGIRKEMIDGIFQPFTQVTEARRRIGGTGLGLTISRELVRSMGGDLRVESTFGAGSTFWFELETVPLPPARQPPFIRAQRVVCGYQGARRKVLLVDDVTENRQMLIQWLRPLGFQTLEAADGREALAKVAEHPDLIIMDLDMPAHGLQAIRFLRQKLGSSTPPIIATSASVSKEDANRSLTAGADAFLPKPIDLMQLEALLGSLLKIDWDFAPVEPTDAQTGAPDVLVAPPLSEVEVLYDLARRGCMRDIQQRASHVASLDKRYEPFARELQRLAGNYESMAVRSFIERYRNETHRTGHEDAEDGNVSGGGDRFYPV